MAGRKPTKKAETPLGKCLLAVTILESIIKTTEMLSLLTLIFVYILCRQPKWCWLCWRFYVLSVNEPSTGRWKWCSCCDKKQRGLQCGELTLTVTFIVHGVTLDDPGFRSFSLQRWLSKKKSCDYEQARYVQVKFYWSKLIMYIVSNLWPHDDVYMCSRFQDG